MIDAKVFNAVCLSLSAALLLSACGYGWKDDSVVYPPSGTKVQGTGTVTPLGPDEYVVQPGDTLYSIGFRNQIDYHDLASWNGVGSDYLIRSGQLLRLAAPGQSRPVPEEGVHTQPLPPTALPPVANLPITKPTPIPPLATKPENPGPVSLPPPPLTPVGVPAIPVLSVPSAPHAMPIGASGGRWAWPSNGSVVKIYNLAAGAKGIDIAGELGQPVNATAAGKVVYSGSALKGYGELVIVKHDENYLSAYGYNRRRLVKEGDEVKPGQTIAELGVGPEQKPILHFEIREHGKPVDPLGFLPPR